MDVKDKIKSVPLGSGVYLMKDSCGKVIYVGKAVSLRARVQSYFRRARGPRSKTDLLVAEIADIDTIETASEAGALILEASLIKEYAPKYNVDLRDDKSYPYVEITGEVFPRIGIERPRVKTKRSLYYGPYVKVGLLREAMIMIRKIFPFRTCDPFPNKECLDFHLGLCGAPCIQKIGRREYARNVRNVRWVLEGKKDTLYRRLKKDMEIAAAARRYEDAAGVRDQLRALGALYSGTDDMNYYKEAEQLQRALKLPSLPERIETFDISHIMGEQAVGSMVSFLHGKPDKSSYRRFRIREVEGIDDFRMIAETVKRRYRRLRDEGGAFPDLIVIDGGKGQLSAALAALGLLEVHIPVVSIAKREEDVFVPGRRDPIRLSPDSLGLKLLQRARDEAHRFAVSYHRTVRAKAALGQIK